MIRNILPRELSLAPPLATPLATALSLVQSYLSTLMFFVTVVSLLVFAPLVVRAEAVSAPIPAPPIASPPTEPPATAPTPSGSAYETIEGPLQQNRTAIAVPEFARASDANIAGVDIDMLTKQIAEVVANDLETSGLYAPIYPSRLPAVAMREVTAPRFDHWRRYRAQNLVHGYVQANGDGGLTVGCYLYDTQLKTELVRQGFVIRPAGWRRAAHKCADVIYARLSGEAPFFDSRIAYIAERGPKGNRVKQLAIMDSDGGNHRFITSGQALAISPRFSPDYKTIAYVSYLDERVRLFLYNQASNSQKLLIASENPTFAPRWSPDGRSILFSMAVGGNTDIYIISASGGTPQRLTNSPGIDVGGSFSPDGRQIVFESDRSGSQQLYLMNIDGSNQRRISFGGGRYATPEWSPRGDLIAFTKMNYGEFRIGVMTPQGDGQRLLTDGWQDEAPTWSPNGRLLQFFRTSPGSKGTSSIWQVDLTGVNIRRLQTPQGGSDPAWGPVLP